VLGARIYIQVLQQPVLQDAPVKGFSVGNDNRMHKSLEGILINK
jgi:hypothetical protein